MGYMTKFERELWKNYFETLAQKKHLEEFLQNINKPEESNKEALKAYDEVKLQVKIVSPQRANAMTKNIFISGGFKKLRSDFHK